MTIEVNSLGTTQRLSEVYTPRRVAETTANETDANTWTKLATFTILARYAASDVRLRLMHSSGGVSYPSYVDFNVRVKQQNAFGSDPFIDMEVFEMSGYLDQNQIRLKIVQNTPYTIVELWGNINAYYSSMYLWELGRITVDSVSTVEYHSFNGLTTAPAYNLLGRFAGTPWTTATLSNGWTGSCRYRRLVNGLIELNFNIIAGTTTDNTILFTLPVGYRPGDTYRLHVAAGDSTVSLSACRYTLSTDGSARLYSWAGGTAMADSIVFLAEN